MIRLGTLFWLVLVSATGFAMFGVKVSGSGARGRTRANQSGDRDGGARIARPRCRMGLSDAAGDPRRDEPAIPVARPDRDKAAPHDGRRHPAAASAARRPGRNLPGGNRRWRPPSRLPAASATPSNRERKFRRELRNRRPSRPRQSRLRRKARCGSCRHYWRNRRHGAARQDRAGEGGGEAQPAPQPTSAGKISRRLDCPDHDEPVMIAVQPYQARRQPVPAAAFQATALRPGHSRGAGEEGARGLPHPALSYRYFIRLRLCRCRIAGRRNRAARGRHGPIAYAAVPNSGTARRPPAPTLSTATAGCSPRRSTAPRSMPIRSRSSTRPTPLASWSRLSRTSRPPKSTPSSPRARALCI